MSVRVAVVGAGNWGRNHVRTFADLAGAELTAICDQSEDVRARMQATYPGTHVSPNIDEALEASDAVVIATDAPSHADLARQALAAGRHVLVEKPLTLTSEESSELCELARSSERVFMVGHLLLYHSAIRELRALIEAGELGDVLYMVCRRLNLGVVRQRENAWWSLAPHDLSIARYLFGNEPTSAAASAGTFLQKGIADVVFGTVRFGDSQLAHIHVSWLDPHKVRSLTVVGSKKMATFDDTSPDQKLVVFDKGAVPPQTLSYADGVRVRTGDIRIPAIRLVEPLRSQCTDFIESIRDGRRPVADGASGLAVVRALEAGQRSLEAGGEEVAIAP
ncbi:MAG: Gfo/Idh/MocA family oxidoreductase [Myxococcota bacterium]